MTNLDDVEIINNALKELGFINFEIDIKDIQYSLIGEYYIVFSFFVSKL